MAMTPEQRVMRARLAAHTRWSREDPAEQARKMRAGVMAKFLAEVDPDGSLPPAERERRALHAQAAHMGRLALRSSRSRGRAAGAASGAAA